MKSESTPKSLSLSRRQFLTACAPALGGAAAGISLLMADHKSAAAAPHVDADGVPAILIDVSRCVGCGNCQRSCATANGLSCDGRQEQLGAETYTVVESIEVAGGKDRFVKRGCMQCLHPACASACPVGALHQDARGVVVADTSKCIGCRYCQYACPFGVPRFEWDNPLGVMRKCTGCDERVAKGQKQACVAGCPTGALSSGPRGALLKEAHARIAASGGKYIDAVYGEKEAGGVSRLYISDVPFEGLGLPMVGPEPVPIHAESIVTRTPAIALSVAALCTGTYAFMKRREGNMGHDEAPSGAGHAVIEIEEE
jgi:formate dehydrogenase iron-sulfur subunit